MEAGDKSAVFADTPQVADGPPPLAPASAPRRLILPALCAVAVAAAAEIFLSVTFHPTFWQKTTWLMHDPYLGELFDRNHVYIRLSHLEDTDPDIVSVGDSTGFFSLQPTVINRYLGGMKFLNLNVGANQGYAGYAALAEYMLRRSHKTKYVVLYVYPQLLPQEEFIGRADLGAITYNDLDGPRSRLTPPSAFLAPYGKFALFEGRRFHADEPLNRRVPSMQLMSTIDDAFGWLPDYDVRFNRIDDRTPFSSDQRSTWRRYLGLGDPSSVNANLDAFDRMVRSHGARLIVAFAPIAGRALAESDPNVRIADRALERFQREHPDVKFLFPLVTRWGAEKFSSIFHISREYSFLASQRVGTALARLLRDPDSIPSYLAQAEVPSAYPPIIIKPAGPADRALLTPALALYLFTSTDEQQHRQLLSRRVEDLLEREPGYRYAMADARARIASLARRGIRIGFDLVQMRATPVEVEGLPDCAVAPGRTPQWVQLDGAMTYTYASPAMNISESIPWPTSARVVVPLVFEDGLHKFDGYCPESTMTDANVPVH
jgi:hypothetical protein